MSDKAYIFYRMQYIALMLDDVKNSIAFEKEKINDIKKKIASLKKQEFTKEEIDEIRKTFNFFDFNADDEKLYRQLKPKFSPITKEDIESGLINVPFPDYIHSSSKEDSDDAEDKAIEKAYDEISGSDLDGNEDDVKPVTIEQYKDVVGDTEKLVKSLKKDNIEENKIDGCNDNKNEAKDKKTRKRKTSKK